MVQEAQDGNQIASYQASPRFWAKSGGFVAVLAKHRHVIFID